ncbi:unnamed protein product [Arctia plantaginis]|uniref:Uncharacterized protein n=1 Tax=Arctia plantaginis TaxID=874455 RepID=A0A8S0Z9A6_ARCPL|nr:unnamed protein product [Arctia plantaginis]
MINQKFKLMFKTCFVFERKRPIEVNVNIILKVGHLHTNGFGYRALVQCEVLSVELMIEVICGHGRK